jgi:hypothetical protein
MATLSFENLDFSFWIEPESKTAYLQEWEEGAWSEAERFSLPQPLDGLVRNSRLARAIRSFRRDHHYEALCSALEHGLEREAPPVRRGFAARIFEFIYA